MSARQDRQGARTPADLEYKYRFGKSFKEVMGIADDARTAAEDAQLAAKKLDEGLTSEEIFNRLTQNGAVEGIYRDSSGQIYVNASYIKSGELLADLIKTGVLKSKSGGFELNLDSDTLKMLAGSNEVFKADVDGVTLSSNGEEVITVTDDGAILAGWEATKEYLGREESGLNGNADFRGTSAKYTVVEQESVVRFFAGVNDDVASKYMDVRGAVDSWGNFDTTVSVPYMVADTSAHTVNSVWYNNTSLIEAEMGTLFGAVRVDDKTLRIVGSVTKAYMESIGKSGGDFALTVKLKYDIKVPAYQVLDDGTLVAKYAVLGGHNIKDLIARIEALEKNSK